MPTPESMNAFSTCLTTIYNLLLQVPADEAINTPLSESSGRNIEVLEYGLVMIVIIFQFWFFLKTRATIQRFKNSLPEVSLFSLVHATVLQSDLKEVPPQELIDKLDDYKQRTQLSAAGPEMMRYEKFQEYMRQGDKIRDEVGDEPLPALIAPAKANITLLKTQTEVSPILTKISQAINTYLIRNKGAVADFNLLRDIVQRNLDSIEEEIAVTTPIPVYLGLVGTMIGIIIGLFSLPDIGSESFIQGNGIANLLGGVKIAMIASAMGLILTIYTNGLLFRGAKSLIESNKNDLFTFLQTELLPVLSESVNAGIINLNRSLDRFGVKFAEDVQQLEGLVQKNYESLRTQQSALDTLQKIDVSKVATFNIKVLGELSRSMNALERLAFGFKNLDTFVVNARALVERSQDVVGLTDKIGEILDYTKELQFYLNGHFKDLENRGNLITNTVAKIDDVISREIEGLEKNIHARIRAVGEIKVEEDAWLQQAMRENQTALSKLKLLEPLQANLNNFIKENTTVQRSLATTLQNVAKKSNETNELLALILKEEKNRGFGSQLKRIFGGSKTKNSDHIVEIKEELQGASKYRNEIERLKVENQDIKLTNEELLNELSRIEKPTKTDNQSPLIKYPNEDSSLTPSSLTKVFFLSTPVPTPDGFCTFLDQRKPQFDPASSFYRFELINTDENQAQFRFENASNNVRLALSDSYRYLHPACEYSKVDLQAIRIETYKQGKAIRQGNVWKVIEKAHVKFI